MGDEWVDVTVQHKQAQAGNDEWQDVTAQHMGFLDKAHASVQAMAPNANARSTANAYSDPRELNAAAGNALLPGASAEFAAAKQLGPMARTGMSILQGGTTAAIPEPGDQSGDQLGRFLKGGLVGGAVGGGMEAAKVGAGAISRPIKTAGMAYQLEKNPAAMEAGLGDELGGAIQTLRDKGKNEFNPKLQELLKGKQVPVMASKMQGIDPEVDTILRKATPGQNPMDSFKQMSGLGQEAPINVDAEELKRAKQLLDKNINWKKTDLNSPSEVPLSSKVASLEQAKGASSTAREGVKSVGGEVPQIYEDWQKSIKLADKLQKGANSSASATMNPTLVRKGAALQSADQLAGSQLLDKGKQLQAARNLGKKVEHGKIFQALGVLGKEGIKGGINAAKNTPSLEKSLENVVLDPKASSEGLSLQALLSAYANNADKR